MTIALTQFNDKNVAILGLGKAGCAATAAVSKGGGQPWSWDDDQGIRVQRAKQGFDLHDLRDDSEWRHISALIVSPGIPKNHPALSQARLRDVPVYGEVELLQKMYPEACYIGVTGTNGKSTVTALIGHVLLESGKKCQSGGNLGLPALGFEPPDKDSYCVLEMSSFQLKLSRQTHFNIALLLNISPDHLDYHGSMTDYITAKLSLFAGVQKKDKAIISLEDPLCRACAQAVKERVEDLICFGSAPMRVRGVAVQGDQIIDQLGDEPIPVIDLTAIENLKGPHNAQNIAAAYAACHMAGVSIEDFSKALASFPGLAHRQQEAPSCQGLRFVNDSKATNPISAAYALASYQNIYWIAGGKMKKDVSLKPISIVLEHLSIQHAFFIGEAAEEFHKSFSPLLPTTISEDLERAFQQATKRALADQSTQPPVILLSPACASYDQFSHFEERGDAFLSLVAQFSGK